MHHHDHTIHQKWKEYFPCRNLYDSMRNHLSLFPPMSVYTSVHAPQASSWSVKQSATGMVCHFWVRAEAEIGYVIQGGIRVTRELWLAGLSHLISRVDDGLAQTGDPLLLAEGVVGLQAVWVSLRAPSAAHAETVPYWEMARKRGEGGTRSGFHFNCWGRVWWLSLSSSWNITASSLNSTANMKQQV